jgi:hypothetical protein
VQGLHDNLPPKHQPEATAADALAPPEHSPTQLFLPPPAEGEEDDGGTEEGYMARSQREAVAGVADLERRFPGELAEVVAGAAGGKRKMGEQERPAATMRSLEALLFKELDLDLGPTPFDVPTAAMFPGKVRVWR